MHQIDAPHTSPQAASQRDIIQLPQQESFPAGFAPVRLAGRGAFSEIWQVRETKTRDFFALKRLRPEFLDDPGARGLLAHEAAAGGAVAGRHVMRVLRSELDAEQPFSLLEWIDGETLEQMLDGTQRLPIGATAWIARQCAQGLSDLADAGFSHGDLKPDNIVLSDRGEVKLIDLGFARPLDDGQAADRGPCVTGTPEYMAPESFSRGSINPLLKDMYSLGVVIYRLLCGRLPFQGTTAEQVMRQHGSVRPADVQSLRPDAPEEFVGLVERLLAKQPVRRPQSYASLIRELTVLELSTLHARFAA